MVIATAVVTLIALSITAAISPKLMAIGAALLFAFLLVRFVWLVGRELH